MRQDTDKQPPGEDTVRDEGDHVARRRRPEAERSFAGKDKLKAEAEELEVARRSAGEGKIHTHPNAGGASDPHTERQLDNGLEETFPASDPVSISPGAD